MIRLIIILLIIYLFVRFYKRMSYVGSGHRNAGRNAFNQRSQYRDNNSEKRFEDVEEAEFVEIKEDSKESSDSKQKKADSPVD